VPVAGSFFLGPSAAPLSLIRPLVSFSALSTWRFADAPCSCRCHFAINHPTLSCTLHYHSSGSLALVFHLLSSFSSPISKNMKSCSKHCIQSSSCRPLYPSLFSGRSSIVHSTCSTP
ncbi:unnamed protein product, partial [Sphacelaria rigidula]